jgi:alkylation response protein AidB-like acyl-CoA dehydrogenase
MAAAITCSERSFELNLEQTMPRASAPHIAGDPSTLTAQQRELIERSAWLGREKFAPRAGRHDRDASFPFENYDDLRQAGMLGLCVPRAYGGEGADFETYMLVSAEIARHCGSTALSYNMHVSACMWSGFIADALEMTDAQRADHERIRALHYDNIVGGGKVYSQPFSEGGAASAGKAPWGTLAHPVDGGYIVNGKKIFASLAGAADFYGVLCTLDKPAATPNDAMYLAVPADAKGISVTGEWDPLGMRATVSRTLVFENVFVPDSGRLLPDGLYSQAAERCPHMFTTLSATYMGLAQAAYDFTVLYLRGEVPGMPPVQRRQYPTKQISVAHMRILLEHTRALFLANSRQARIDPDKDARLRLLAGHYTTMENANAIAALAIRTCGGQAMMRSLPLERIYRDSRCGSLMLPWTAELCLDHLGRDCLYDELEGDEESIET